MEQCFRDQKSLLHLSPHDNVPRMHENTSRHKEAQRPKLRCICGYFFNTGTFTTNQPGKCSDVFTRNDTIHEARHTKITHARTRRNVPRNTNMPSTATKLNHVDQARQT